MEIEKSYASYAGYIVKHTIGKGGQGKVKLGLEGEKQVALKFIPFNKEIEKELAIHRGLSHPNLIKLLNFHVNQEYTKRNGTKEIRSCLVYDYMKDGELYEYLAQTGPFKEETARTLFHQLIDVLTYLHSQGVAHRDLKPENILFQGGVLKVSDLGFATFVGGHSGDGVLASYKGTVSYMAPEILVRQKYVGQSVDIFAAGVVLYLMMTGQLPFKNASAKDQYYNLFCTNRFDQFWSIKERSGLPRYSNEFKTLINGMLAFDPLQRPTISEIVSSPWYQGTSISNDNVIKLLNARKIKIQAQQEKENMQKLLAKQNKLANNQQLTVGIGNFRRGDEENTIDLTKTRQLKKYRPTDLTLPFSPSYIFCQLIEQFNKFANKISYVDDKKYKLHYQFLQNNEEFEMAIQLVEGKEETVGIEFILLNGNGLEFYQKKQQIEDMFLLE